jgi:hypothetical protein
MFWAPQRGFGGATPYTKTYSKTPKPNSRRLTNQEPIFSVSNAGFEGGGDDRTFFWSNKPNPAQKKIGFTTISKNDLIRRSDVAPPPPFISLHARIFSQNYLFLSCYFLFMPTV